MIELYRGMVNTWECDEMGHMNVRFYVAKQMEGLAIMAPYMGLSRCFRPRATTTIVPADQHIRFMKEVHPGRPLVMVGGVLEIEDDRALIYQELKHAISGETAAAFRTWIVHIEAKTGKAFPWRQKTLDALAALKVEAPSHTAPRSIDPSVEPLSKDIAIVRTADDLGIPVIGRGCVPQNHCDTHGRMTPEHFIGRVSDSVPNLMTAWREEVAAAAAAKGEDVKTGAAVLEYRMVYRRWPTAGDIIEVRTGLGEVKPKVHSLVHWLTNPITGKVYWTSEAVAVTFDINTRKVIPANPEHMALLEARIPRGLRI